MEFYVYNTLTRKKELFQTINHGIVKLYTCWPTVYDFSHVGNFRTFIFEDLLKRWLIHLGYEVNHIMNITDVDDKTIAKSIKKKVPLKEITEKYISSFIKDLNWLNIVPADNYPCATDYITQMKDMIQTLLDKGKAYKHDDGSVYFKISSFQDYGKLSNIKINNKKLNSRIISDEYDKNNVQDFVLWKAWKIDDGNVFWDSPWGKGRPGWHIECSAMSKATLGSQFDIHCGGVDNIFPHHENEIAQSQCANGKSFVNYWLHSEFLMINDSKMSKSLVNYYILNDLKKMNFSPESIRYQLLSGHYRTKLLFSLRKKHESDKIIQRINDFYIHLKENDADRAEAKTYPSIYKDFQKAMNDDLNTPKAIAIFMEWMRNSQKKIANNKLSEGDLGDSWRFLKIFDSIFGFIKKEKLVIPHSIRSILDHRKHARDQKNWKLSDELRQCLKEMGWAVEDTSKGQRVKKL